MARDEETKPKAESSARPDPKVPVEPLAEPGPGADPLADRSQEPTAETFAPAPGPRTHAEPYEPEGYEVVRLLREVEYGADRLPVNAVIETTPEIAARLAAADPPAAEPADPDSHERYPINPILTIGRIFPPLVIDPDR